MDIMWYDAVACPPEEEGEYFVFLYVDNEPAIRTANYTWGNGWNVNEDHDQVDCDDVMFWANMIPKPSEDAIFKWNSDHASTSIEEYLFEIKRLKQINGWDKQLSSEI